MDNLVYEDTGVKGTKEISEIYKNFDESQYYEYLKKERVEIVSFLQQDYPRMLRYLENFPPLLHYKGDLKALNTLPEGIAVVGSRKISPYGQRLAYDLGYFLGHYNIPVVSCLAYGVDYEVHKGVIKAGGYPVAVIANGLERIYPKEHERMAKKITEMGVLLTEEFLYSQIAAYKFPIRNRIISGLSKVIVVVEAEEKSGSLITARHGLEQGKTVYAVPGSYYSKTSKGTNKLIADGAIPLTDFNQLIEEYSKGEVKKKIIANNILKEATEMTDENKIISIFERHEWLTVEMVAQQMKMDIQNALAMVMKLEIEGKIRQVQGNKYILL